MTHVEAMSVHVALCWCTLVCFVLISDSFCCCLSQVDELVFRHLQDQVILLLRHGAEFMEFMEGALSFSHDPERMHSAACVCQLSNEGLVQTLIRKYQSLLAAGEKVEELHQGWRSSLVFS